MSTIAWKQLSRNFFDQAAFTGSLYITGSFFLNDINILQQIQESGILKRTGSYWAATTDLQITGSVDIKLDGSEDTFSVDVNNESKFKINEEGVAVFGSFLEAPTPVEGGLFFSQSKEFFVGL